jgi:hypothetical protein
LKEEELKKNRCLLTSRQLFIGQIYLMDNPLLKEPLRIEHIKPRACLKIIIDHLVYQELLIFNILILTQIERLLTIRLKPGKGFISSYQANFRCTYWPITPKQQIIAAS